MDDNHDLKTNIAGIVAGVCGLLVTFHVGVPEAVTANIQTIAGFLASIGIIVLAYFTNKGKK